VIAAFTGDLAAKPVEALGAAATAATRHMATALPRTRREVRLEKGLSSVTAMVFSSESNGPSPVANSTAGPFVTGITPMGRIGCAALQKNFTGH
jgi:hypothetical protein